MASTELRSRLKYVVPPTVRVRREAFGLLFYDTRSTNLTFVRSGDRLVPLQVSASGERELRVIEPPTSHDDAVGRLLETLRAKGLVVAVGRACQ